MSRSQRSGSVERLVMASLRKQLRPTFGEMSDLAYAKMDLDPNAYKSLSQFKRDYLVFSFLRKWKGLDTGIDLEQTAFEAWLKAEQQCFHTNRRLNLEAATGNYSVAPSVIVAAQRKVASILGRWDPENIVRLCRFGPGATADRRKGTLWAEKFLRPSVTLEAVPLVCRVVSGDEYVSALIGGFKDLTVRDSNRMVMVPKNSKTDRTIAAEPTLNSFVQQGVGRYIRHRLKMFGVDLDDQTINQVYASKAKEEGLTTLDLSMASDTLCTSLVKLLLPREWFEVLDSLRSRKTTFKGRTFVLSKFSSMGNAFTFELESMIFFALLSAVCESDVISVYGDDLVVRNTDAAKTIEILSWAGFNVNHDKSFTEGSRFYESCGQHYFDDVEVTPCYQKDVCRRPVDYVHLHNRLVRAAVRLGLREELRPCIQLVRDECRRVFGERRTPDVGPVVEYDEYFIDWEFTWGDDRQDRVQLRSYVGRNDTLRHHTDLHNVAYYGRKLRSDTFLNPCPRGHCSDVVGQAFHLKRKAHWRSATS